MFKRRKEKTADERQNEIERAKVFGKHVSKRKGYLLLAFTLLACATPILLGMRVWEKIPEIVPSGLIGPNGEDDSLPRAVVVFGLPGLMCVLNLISHMQLLINQKRMTLPAAPVRLLGRWGFPVISVLFCSGMIMKAAGLKTWLSLPFLTPCILGLLMMLLGGHMWECPRDARIALRFSFCSSDSAWETVHRFAGGLWLTVGLLAIAGVMLTGTSTVITALVLLLALAAPVLYGYLLSRRQ